jgi:selenocysteine lyase/cysteine desulfurase
VDVRALGVDFAVGGMLKYLLGTAGIGFLYVRDALVPSLIPANSGWFAQEDIGAMDITANRPAPSARRFEAGTPAVVNCYAAEAGLRMLLRVGTDAVEGRIRALTARCMRRLREIDWSSVTPSEDDRRGATVAVPSRHPGRLVQELKDRGIVTSYRDDNVRAAFHFYNDEADIDAFCAALSDLRAALGPAPEQAADVIVDRLLDGG